MEIRIDAEQHRRADSTQGVDLHADHYTDSDSTYQEHKATHQSEEVHRLLAELVEEPDRHQVEVAVHKAAHAELRHSELTFAVLECFNQHGIELERTQLDFIISSVVKENLANLLLVTDSLKQILCSIEKQMTDAGDHAVVKNYTSVYLVTLLTLRQAQDVAIRDLETNATRVDTLIQVAKDNINEACTIAGYEHDKTLQSNIKLNERSIQISKTYKDILLNFSKQLADERPGLERSIKVARNLYNTVETASNLITVIKQSSYDYKALFRFSMPKINQIYASNMAREFDNISAKLRELQSQE